MSTCTISDRMRCQKDSVTLILVASCPPSCLVPRKVRDMTRSSEKIVLITVFEHIKGIKGRACRRSHSGKKKKAEEKENCYYQGRGVERESENLIGYNLVKVGKQGAKITRETRSLPPKELATFKDRCQGYTTGNLVHLDEI
ncbi:hypothetical protein NPIL_448581 [Nephila pilipes]|uniref:Uncharacterized protein n=1 Tax=Nephila pilipes TaxID=299642 RepID=A0A8X6MEA2_NEPPI|nr:hypothetical protein NPIL_448581 [Nephila pilipes]